MPSFIAEYNTNVIFYLVGVCIGRLTVLPGFVVWSRLRGPKIAV